jgi:hypothetical protein
MQLQAHVDVALLKRRNSLRRQLLCIVCSIPQRRSARGEFDAPVRGVVALYDGDQDRAVSAAVNVASQVEERDTRAGNIYAQAMPGRWQNEKPRRGGV